MDLLPQILSGAADLSTIAICAWLIRLDRRVLRLEILAERGENHA